MKRRAGFALVITVVLLALLVLAVYALSALGRVGAEVSATGTYQTQARQNALLGLSQAVGALQRYAGEDDMLTGMAGVAGIPAGPGQSARHWCGVWDRDGDFFHWLVSGAGPAGLVPASNRGAWLTLVGAGSLGTDGTDKEHVRALRLPVVVHTRDRGSVPLGGYAWWVGDEGVKLSAVAPRSGGHAIGALISLEPETPSLNGTVSYEQIALVPTTVTATALAGQLRSNFHALGHRHLNVVGANGLAEGTLNVNTTSQPYWRGVAATYNRLKPASAAALSPVAFAASMNEHFRAADPGAGKEADGPFPSAQLFLNSAALSGALAASGGSLLQFGDVMGPRLVVRSDTFRVRAYGDAVNPADPARLEGTAWCEAIVQRVKDEAASPAGRFVVTYFRWLGPDDI